MLNQDIAEKGCLCWSYSFQHRYWQVWLCNRPYNL